MCIVVVHTTFQEARKIGLFGLLSDAPIQLVDTSDKVRLGAFMDFAERCESKNKRFIVKKQNFHRLFGFSQGHSKRKAYRKVRSRRNPDTIPVISRHNFWVLPRFDATII